MTRCGAVEHRGIAKRSPTNCPALPPHDCAESAASENVEGYLVLCDYRIGTLPESRKALLADIGRNRSVFERFRSETTSDHNHTQCCQEIPGLLLPTQDQVLALCVQSRVNCHRISRWHKYPEVVDSCCCRRVQSHLGKNSTT